MSGVLRSSLNGVNLQTMTREVLRITDGFFSMRQRIISLLKDLEYEKELLNVTYTYEDYETGNGECCVEELLTFPNYQLIFDKYYDRYLQTYIGSKSIVPRNNILAELQRMESDGLVMVRIQECEKVFSPDVIDFRPEKRENFKTESIVLTTRGKSKWGYSLHKAWENPISTGIAISALLVSIIALWCR